MLKTEWNWLRGIKGTEWEAGICSQSFYFCHVKV